MKERVNCRIDQSQRNKSSKTTRTLTIKPLIRDRVLGEKRVKLPTWAVSAFTKCINRDVVLRLPLVFLAGALFVAFVVAFVVAFFVSLSVTSMEVISMLSAEASASRSFFGKFKSNVLFFRCFRETARSWCFSSPSACASMSWSFVPL